MPLSDNLRGALFMCAAMAAFTINDTFMKQITQAAPLFQAIAMRGAFTVIALALLVIVMGRGQFFVGPRDARIIGLRTVAEVGATFTFLAALKHMHLGTLTAIFQSLPLAVTLAAALVFGDRIGWRRLTAIGVGFLGVLIIIRPGTTAFDGWSLLVLVSVATVVVRDLATRQLSPDVPSVTVAFWTATVVTLAAGAIAVWQGLILPPFQTAIMVPLAAAFVVVGYLCSIRAMRVGDVGFVAPYRYTALVWAGGLGWVAFGEIPDFWTWVGAGIVVATGLFTMLRERRLARVAQAAA
jgi:drug/metabolite transporter (DMT)-like permease